MKVVRGMMGIFIACLIVWAMVYLVFTFFIPKAHAHDFWANGEAVPDSIKNTCCGVAEAHYIAPEQLHPTIGGWRIDTYYGPDVHGQYPVPYGTTLPSPDGQRWGFWKDLRDESGKVVNSSPIRCIYLPPTGS